MNGFTGMSYKPNLNPDDEEVGLRKPLNKGFVRS